jgi:tetratricopeptide (TPR) repeat protein
MPAAELMTLSSRPQKKNKPGFPGSLRLFRKPRNQKKQEQGMPAKQTDSPNEAADDRNHWPEDWQLTEKTLHPERISRHGRVQLYRAINTRQLIAFVGAGVSSAYGRVGWAELALEHARVLESLLANLDKADPRRALVTQLQQYTDRYRSLPAERITAALLLCEQIWRLSPASDSSVQKARHAKHATVPEEERCSLEYMCRQLDLKVPGTKNDVQHLDSAEAGKECFQAWIKREAHNERPHVLSVLNGTCGENLAEQGARDPARYPSLNELIPKLKGFPLTRENAESDERPYAQLFQRAAIVEWQKRVARAARGGKGDSDAAEWRAQFRKAAVGILKALAERTGDGPVSPARYFAFGAVLDMIRAVDGKSAAADLLESLLRNPRVPRSAHYPRESLIPRDADPLFRLVYDIGVQRFATTNYDLEIERFFHDLSFRTPRRVVGGEDHGNPSSIHVGPIGGRSRDFSLSSQTVADLVDFATNDGVYALEVVHLHGRATEEDPIVVTERDYQDTYLRDGGFLSAFHEARSIAFGGNPILFVGFGMIESDVLRPLREFVTGSVRRNRAVVALLPAASDSAENDTFAMDQYVKHGVCVIHYDVEFVTRPKEKDADPSALRAMLTAITKLSALARDLRETAGDKRWGTVNDSIERLRTLRADGFRCGKTPCDIGFEIELLHTFAKLCERMRRSGKRSREPLQEIARVFLPRLRISVLTHALTSTLVDIHREQQAWWKEWQTHPRDRGETARYPRFNPRGEDPAETKWPIWSRYRVDESVPYSTRPDPGRHPNSLAQFPAKGRRVWLISAGRGAGKGQLYSHLTGTRVTHEKFVYIGQFFTNFGASCEVASVWDVLPLFILSPENFPSLDLVETATDADKEQFTKAWDDLEKEFGISRERFRRWSRRERLDRALIVAAARLKAMSRRKDLKRKKPRIVIVFGMADTLFDSSGQEKHSEIADIMEILLASRHESLPLDLFFILRDSHVPRWFRREPQPRGAVATGNAPAVQLRAVARQELNLLLPKVWSDPWHMEAMMASLRRGDVNVRTPGKYQRPLHVSFEAEEVARECKEAPGSHFVYVLPHANTDELHLEGFDRVLRALRVAVGDDPAGGLALPDFFRNHLGANRYAYTLLATVVRDTVDHSSGDSAARVSEFIRAVEALPGGLEGSVSDKFFELVFDYWFTRADKPVADEELAQKAARDPVLLELLVRHIAVVAMPIRSNVLRACPLVKQRVDMLKRSIDPSLSTKVVLQHALEGLVARGLVLRVDDVPEPGNESGSHQYQVHRAIARHVLRRMGWMQPEQAEERVYAPSLVAAQTRSFPRLYPTAYAFLCELVDKLTSYPAPLSGEVPTPSGTEVCAECLRAALGVVRTLFSLGVVTRFADSDGLPPRSPAQVGYLEHHRLVIRWMVKYGYRLPQDDPKVRSPFYRDETVWLYNECGVFSHVQGRCDDARALFERALELQEKIDGPGGGPMRRRILLNLGLTCIDRGRLNVARRVFREVMRAEYEDEVCWLLARGFNALVDQLAGEIQAAREGYTEAIEGLQRLRRIRPVAMLKIHSGFLYLHMEQFQEARKEFKEAVLLAEAGGYADIVHYAHLAEAKAVMRDPLTRGDFEKALKRLRMAQSYADRMDIPRMTVEVLLFRGEMLIEQGETTRAGELISTALQIATLNRMMFRRVLALELLSKVYEKRENHIVAEQLRGYTRQAARQMGYHFSVFRSNRAVL